MLDGQTDRCWTDGRTGRQIDEKCVGGHPRVICVLVAAIFSPGSDSSESLCAGYIFLSHLSTPSPTTLFKTSKHFHVNLLKSQAVCFWPTFGGSVSTLGPQPPPPPSLSSCWLSGSVNQIREVVFPPADL